MKDEPELEEVKTENIEECEDGDSEDNTELISIPMDPSQIKPETEDNDNDPSKEVSLYFFLYFIGILTIDANPYISRKQIL